MKIIRIILPLFLCTTQISYSQWTVFTPTNTRGIEGTMISSGFEATNDKLWFGTDQGVACFDPEYSVWTNYNTHNSLTNNFVYQVFEDKEGTIWVATNGGGISRYSRNTWENFTTKDGLPYNVVRAIGQSPDGTLWFGTYGHGICSYRAQTGFKKYTSDLIANSYILSILAVSDDLILTGTLNEGLIAIENDTIRSLQNINELTGKKIFSIFRDHNDKIWIGTDKGAHQFDPLSFTVLSCPDSIKGKPVYDICENKANNDLVFTSDNKVYVNNDGSWSAFVPGNVPNSTAVYSAFYDKDGNGWFGSSNNGLFEKKGDSWYNYYHSTGIDTYYYISDMCEDKNHNMWFCSYQKIFRFDGQNWNNIIKNTELQNDYFWKIIGDLDGNVWFTSNNKGLYKYDGNTFTVFARDIHFNGTYIQNLFLGPNGNIWASTYSQGIFRYDGTKWTHFTTADGMADNNVQAIAFYTDGRTVAISSYGTISKYDGKNWTIDNSVSGYSILDMAIDMENNIWLATSNGIVRHKGSENQTFFNDPSQQNYVNFIRADKKGQIWTSRYYNGLLVYSGGNWSSFNTSDGLSSNYLLDILFDSRGRTWVLADNGINMSSSFTGIEEPQASTPGKIVVYPNPFSGSFDIEYSSNIAATADIRIFSSDGRLVKQYNQVKVDIGGNTFHFEPDNNWPDGLLFCRFIMSGSSENIKLLKVSTH